MKRILVTAIAAVFAAGAPAQAQLNFTFSSNTVGSGETADILNVLGAIANSALESNGIVLGSEQTTTEAFILQPEEPIIQPLIISGDNGSSGGGNTGGNNGSGGNGGSGGNTTPSTNTGGGSSGESGKTAACRAANTRFERNLRGFTTEALNLQMQFAVNSDVLSSISRQDLGAVARGLVDNNLLTPEVRIFIVGHTDTSGSYRYNFDLSERRAESAASFLAGQGVPWRNMQVDGLGECNPINGLSGGNGQNRRVTFIIAR